MEDLIGRKMIGFRFEDDEHRFFCADTMEKYVGSLGEILHFGMNGTVCVKFPNGDGFYYPIELVEEHLIPEGVKIPERVKVQGMEEVYVSGFDSSTKTKVGGIEKLTENLVGKKVTGFQFDEDEYNICFAPDMEDYVGRKGEIVGVEYEEGTVLIEFDDRVSYYYPLEEVRRHMLPKLYHRMLDNPFDEDDSEREGHYDFLRTPKTENLTNSSTDTVVDDKVPDMDKYVSECDPHGVKNNSEKLPMSKLKVQFPNALQAVVLCSSMGHEKYKDSDEDWLNFTRVPGGSETYRDACERHSLYKVGDVDEESGLPHLFHELWNKMAEVEIWISENNKEINI